MCLQLPSSLQSFIIIYVGFSKKQKSLQVFPDRNHTGASRTKSSSCCRELKDRQRPSPLTAARTMSGSWRQRSSKPRASCQGLHLLVLVHAGPCWSLTSPTNQLLKKNGEKQNFFVSTCFYLYVDMQHSAHDFRISVGAMCVLKLLCAAAPLRRSSRYVRAMLSLLLRRCMCLCVGCGCAAALLLGFACASVLLLRCAVVTAPLRRC